MKRSPLRRCSKKRAAQLRTYSKLRKEFLEEHPWCEWWLDVHGVHTSIFSDNQVLAWFGDNQGWMWATPPFSEDIHHKNGRFGSRLNDTSQWMAVSREGHEWIHAHPKEAREKGWLT